MLSQWGKKGERKGRDTRKKGEKSERWKSLKKGTVNNVSLTAPDEDLFCRGKCGKSRWIEWLFSYQMGLKVLFHFVMMLSTFIIRSWFVCIAASNSWWMNVMLTLLSNNQWVLQCILYWILFLIIPNVIDSGSAIGQHFHWVIDAGYKFVFWIPNQISSNFRFEVSFYFVGSTATCRQKHDIDPWYSMKMRKWKMSLLLTKQPTTNKKRLK